MSDQSWTPLTPADWAAGLGDAFHQALSNAAGPDQAAPLTALAADQMDWRTLATLLATPGFLEQSPVDAAAAAAGLLGKLDAVRVEAAHRALLAGADVADVRRAVGAASLVELDNQWHRWASERRAAGQLSDDDYRAVAARLDAADDDGAERVRRRADDPSASGVRPALLVPQCGCVCADGGWCGGCGHAGCGRA